jgi:hypothetical protein
MNGAFSRQSRDLTVIPAAQSEKRLLLTNGLETIISVFTRIQLGT